MRGMKLLIFLVVFLGAGYGIYYGVHASNCPDSDADGLDNCVEATVYHTEKFSTDTDGDGYADGEEIDNDYSPHYGESVKLSEVDSDRDGLMDSEEIVKGTNLVKFDTDGDGRNDFLEISEETDPLDSLQEEPKFDKLKDKIHTLIGSQE